MKWLSERMNERMERRRKRKEKRIDATQTEQTWGEVSKLSQQPIEHRERQTQSGDHTDVR